MTAASMKRKQTIATKKLHVLLLVLLLLTTTESQATTITVSNPTPLQRHEVVEVPWWGDKAQSVTVRDVFGIAQPCQLTHDGRLLIFVSVRPNGKATYTVSEGSATATEGDSTATRPWVAMGYHPERPRRLPLLRSGTAAQRTAGLRYRPLAEKLVGDGGRQSLPTAFLTTGED